MSVSCYPVGHHSFFIISVLACGGREKDKCLPKMNWKWHNRDPPFIFLFWFVVGDSRVEEVEGSIDHHHEVQT